MSVRILHIQCNAYSDTCLSSLHIEVQIASPAVKVVPNEDYNTSRSLPVFNERDRVSGQIILDPSCHPSGRLSIAVSYSLLHCFHLIDLLR